TPGAESCDSYNIFEPTPLDCISIKSSASNYLHDHDIYGKFLRTRLKLDYSGDSNGPWEKQQKPAPPTNASQGDSHAVASGAKSSEQLQHDLLQQLQQQFQMAAVQQQQHQQRQLLQHQHSHPPFQQQQQPQQLQQQQQQHGPSAHHAYAPHSHPHPPLQHHLSLGGAPIYQQLQSATAAATSIAPTAAYHCQYSTPQHHYRAAATTTTAAGAATTTAAAAATIRRRTLSHVARSYSVCATMTPATAVGSNAATTSLTIAALQQQQQQQQKPTHPLTGGVITSSSNSNNSSSSNSTSATAQLSVAGHHKTGIMVAASRCRSPIMLCHSHSDGEFPMYR
ncbi:hypothetical protein KR093_010386, partial [Drosophila rubida]